MQTYTYSVSDTATAIIQGPDGFDPAKCFKGQLPDGGVWVSAPDNIEPGATFANGSWTNPLPPVPQSVSRFQARAALLGAGLLASIEAAIAQADPVAQLAWSDAQEFRRDSPTVLAISAGLGLTDEQLDELFRTASTITA